MPELPRIGAIYPDDAWVDEDVRRMVAEFRCFLPEGVEMVTVETPIPNKVASAEIGVWLAENGDIEEAAQRLLRYNPDCFAYFCTTVSFIRGVGMDKEISARITDATGLPATNTSTAMVRALKCLGVTRLALASPYMPDVEKAFIAFLEGNGFEIVGSVALNLPDGHGIVPPERIRAAAEEADRPEAEAVVVGCTGQKLGEMLDDMEAVLGKPVLSANQVTVWDALQLIGCEPVVANRGSLFSSSTPGASS